MEERFRYLVQPFDPPDGVKKLEEQLNGVGANGWELVTVVYLGNGQGQAYYRKRLTPGDPGDDQ